MHVVVIGGGALGVAAAAAAHARGLDTTLVERSRPGAGTTSRGVGIVRENQWDPTNVRLVRRSIELLAAWEVGPWRYRRTGSATLVPPSLVGTLRALAKTQEELGVRIERLTPSDARRLPGFADAELSDVAEVLHHPDDGWGLPRLYAETTEFHARTQGLRVIYEDARLVSADGRSAVRAGDQTLRADVIVVAAGVWTRGVLRGAGLDAPLLAYRTQAMRLAQPDAHLLPIVHDLAQGCYHRPSWPGQMVVGDGTTTTPEDATDWRAEADEAFTESALRRVSRRFPQIAGARITAAWAGIEAATPDRLPLVGPHPERDDVWLLAGGNGHGFMRAPALGESVAAMLAGGAPPVDVSAFAPRRFAGRMGEPFAIREGGRFEGPPFK